MKTVDNATPVAGSNVVFTIRASNAGPGDAANVIARDVLPSGYTFISANAPATTTYNSTTGIWTIGNLASGSNISLTITVRVNATGIYTNTATIATTSPDGNTADNTSTVTPVPTPLSDVLVVKTVNNATPVVGSNVVFTIRIANTGPSDATGVIATDLLPSGYTFVSANAPASTTYNSTTGNWTIGNLVSGSNASLTITARVNASGTYAKMKAKTILLLAFFGLFINSLQAQTTGTFQVKKGMIKVTVLYPNGEGKTFDMDYYTKKHMPLMATFFGEGLKLIAIDKGIASGAPDKPVPFLAIGYLYSINSLITRKYLI